MGANRSNYPRQREGEEVIENYVPWQWALLFLAALSPGLLSLWYPTFQSDLNLYYLLRRIVEIASALTVVSLPFLFGNRSLIRAVKDRIGERTSWGSILIALSGTILIAIPGFNSSIRDGAGLIHSRTAFGGNGWYEFTLFWVYILTILVRSVVLLLILCIPSHKERFWTYTAFVSFFASTNLIGQFFVMSSRSTRFPLAEATPNWLLWFLLGALAEFTYFIIIWLLDRISFPSLRPILVKLIFAQLFFRIISLRLPTGWLNVHLHLATIAIPLGYWLFLNRDFLPWVVKEDHDPLQSE